MLRLQARMLISLVLLKTLIRNNRDSASEGTRGSVTWSLVIKKINKYTNL